MKKQIVAIVGRPNVGKSTLFNRIIRKREAIVDDSPGVTRDRNYAPAEWSGIEFELLDTGGFVPTSSDVFEQAIRRQIAEAIAESEVIIFVVDITTGITPLDQEIANVLLESGVTVVLGVNKVDNTKREADILEFYSLGLGEPHPISAISGRALGDFLDVVVSSLQQRGAVTDKNPEPLNLAIIGRPNVGKSSYVNAILGQEKLIVTAIPGTTRDAIDTSLRYKKRDIVLIDTAGLRKRSKVRENIEYFSTVRTMHALHRCDVAIVLVDAVEGLTDQDNKIISKTITAGKGVVVGVNKWDLVSKETGTAREFELDFQESNRHLSYVPILFISVKNKQRIFKLLDMSIAVYEERRKIVATSDLNAFLESAVSKHHPPAFGDKWIRLNYVTQLGSEPPLFAFFTNEPRGIRKGYRNYLENQLRLRFGFMGVPLRFSFRKKN
jgi:GTP-binding protein